MIDLITCRFSTTISQKLILGILLSGIWAVSAEAGEITLKNGVRIDGKAVPLAAMTTQLAQKSQGEWTSYPILMIDTGMQFYFVPAKNVEEVVQDETLAGKYETFAVKQTRQGAQRTPTSVGTFVEVTPFDEFGRRRVTVRTSKGDINIVQGITELNSQHIKVEGLTHQWEFALATTSVPPEIIDRILKKHTDPLNPDDRLAIARFYLEAGLYVQSSEELFKMKQEFPELTKRISEMEYSLRQLHAKKLLRELRQRRSAGQYQLAYAAARQFPRVDLKPEVLREVDELIQSHLEGKNKIDQVNLLLGELQANLQDQELIQKSDMIRNEIRDQLDFETLPRLDAFLKLQADATLQVEEKLALAYSGWMLGSAKALTNIQTVFNLWESRYLVMEYLRSSDPQQHVRILEKAENLEGFSAERLELLVKHLPMPKETPGIVPGKPFRIEVTDAGANHPIAYWVQLPQEYSPSHTYPAIVTLHSGDGKDPIKRQMLWWGGTAENPLQAQRRGYIVIAPEYAAGKAYDYSAAAHERILHSLFDARKRFNINSDRVFLSGHGMGGNAVFDLGMSHPDLFAGVIPITGYVNHYCKWYWSNSKNLPWYIVGGELDRDTLERNAVVINRMMRYGHDMIYAEYTGRGYESFYAEIHKLFDWMELAETTRTRFLKDVEVKILRASDSRFFWVELDEMPDSVIQSGVLTANPRQRINPMTLTAEIKDGSERQTSIYVRSGAKKTTLNLSPEFIDYERRLVVRIGSRTVFNDFPSKDIRAMLEDLRIRGDRQKLIWTKLVFD